MPSRIHHHHLSIVSAVVAAAVYGTDARAGRPDIHLGLAGSESAIPREAPGEAVIVSRHSTRGVPSLLLAAGSTAPRAGSPERAARLHLEQQRTAYGVSRAALAAAQVEFTHDVGRGGVIVALRQVVDGVELFENDIKVLLDRSHRLIAISGSPHPLDVAAPLVASTEGKRAALAAALGDLHERAVDPGGFAAVDEPAAGGFERFVAGRGDSGGIGLHRPARVKPVYFPLGEVLVPAYVVEVQSFTREAPEAGLHQYVIGAEDGRVLYRAEGTAHAAFQYRVWAETGAGHRPLDGATEDFSPHPFGVPTDEQPGYVEPNLVTMDGFNTNPDGEADPWLPAGATESIGNHVDAYVDHYDPSGYRPADGEFRASVSAPGMFDYTYDVTAEPLSSQEQSMAAIVQAFYVTNWLHDWWYDSGFTEATGNAQADNFGRGGLAGDRLLVEAQDGVFVGKLDYASMTTPYDGESPWMQLCLQYAKVRQASLTVDSLDAAPVVKPASFGPKVFDLSAELVLADDGAGVSTSDACQPLVNDVAGKIVVIDRGGGCLFAPKAVTAAAAGAAGVILVTNKAGEGAFHPGKGFEDEDPGIPTVGMSLEDGATLKAALLNGPLIGHLEGFTSAHRDTALDTFVIAHEYAHYIHKRLVPAVTTSARSQSEGWGDFLSLYTILREGDDLDGVYAAGTYIAGHFDPSAYFGGQRLPYSVDMNKNALTFRHISDGEPLPDNAPLWPNGRPNSELHNAGQVWATMLWELYVGLQAAHEGEIDFATVQRRMADYVVAGMMLAPPEPTFIEQRDALLTAIAQQSVEDYVLAAEAFARRGAGTCAIGPVRDSIDLVGVVEDFEVRPRGVIAAASLDDAVASCDGDGLLDHEEAGRLSLTVRNLGAAPLVGATIAVLGAPDNLALEAGDAIAVPDVAPYAEAVVELEAALVEASGATPLTLTLRLATPDGCEASTELTLPTAVDADRTASGGTADDVEGAATLWTIGGSNGDAAWSRGMSATTGQVWRATGPAVQSDTWLTSPPLMVSAEEPLLVTFEHAYAFETRNDPLQYVDGAVIEISHDGGASWEDVADHVTEDAPYPGVIAGALNPLFGRHALVATNPSYPGRDAVTLDFGTTFAGETVQLRFRVATNPTKGSAGWELDNFAFSGIVGGPFARWIDDEGVCGPEAPTTSEGEPGETESTDSTTDEPSDAGGEQSDDASGCACSSEGGRSGALQFAPLLALVGLRRRRARR